MTVKTKASVTNRDNVTRIQYKTSAKQPSSFTIDPMFVQLLAMDENIGDAVAWLQNKARQVRDELMEQARELEEKGALVKVNDFGNSVHVTPEEFIRGKVSAQVRLAVIKIIAREELVSKLSF